MSKFLKSYGWILTLFVALLLAHIVLGESLQDANSFADNYTVLMLTTWLGLLILLGMLGTKSWQLYTQLKQKRPGARITARLTLIATLLMSIPAVTTFIFSTNFIQKGINEWFDVSTETALENASSLARLTLDNQTRNTLKLTETLSADVFSSLVFDPVAAVAKIRSTLSAQEAALYQTSTQQLIAFSSQDSTQILPTLPGDNLFQQVRQNKSYAAVEYSDELTTNKNQFIRIFIPVDTPTTSLPTALQVIIPISSNLTDLSNSVATATGQYREMSYLKGPLINSLVLVLSTLVLLTLISSMLFTMRAIQDFTSPIRHLARGTRAVSEGDYNVKISVSNDDEFGDLAKSFNAMTQRIAKARNEIKIGEQRSVIQRLYLETILQSLNSGVITLGTNGQLRTNNQASEKILDIQLKEFEGKTIAEIIDFIGEDRPALTAIIAEIMPAFAQAVHDLQDHWTMQLEYPSRQGQKILMLTGSILLHSDTTLAGYVIVFDDITDLAQAQRNAAWSDVARRLAHEIKNPLTPIQLSAERLNYKLNHKLEGADQDLLQRMTATIIDQVATMKSLVQAFSDYANTPTIMLQCVAINQTIQSISEMYIDPVKQWQPILELDPADPAVNIDLGRLRQLFHNLIKNALEAMENVETPMLRISTQELENALEIRLQDNGPGIPEEAQNWIFEPYATDKPKGTGLGLAVVKKIVEEHKGQISLETSPESGSCFIISLPLATRDDT